MSGRKKRQKLAGKRRSRREAEAGNRDGARLNARIESGEVVIADQSQQADNNSYSPPEFYEDLEFVCVDCGSEEVWTAKQQQWWYEVAKGSIYSRAIRCRACRDARRDQPRPDRESD